MKDLSPAARELVDAHRSDRTLTSADRKRIKDGVMVRVAALGATTAVAAELTTKVATTATVKAAGVSLASKVAVVALAVTAAAGVASVSVRALRARAPSHPTASETPGRTIGRESDVVAQAPRPAEGPTTGSAVAARTTVPAASRPVVAAPATVPPRAMAATRRVAVATPAARLERRPAVTAEATAVPAGSAATDSAHRDPVKTTDDPPKTPTAAAPRVVPPDPEPELRVLRQARDDLRAGHPASAYRRLDEFDRQASAGVLAQERRALSAIALCQWQPGGQARARAAEFLRSAPESPLAIRVRSACAPASKASP